MYIIIILSIIFIHCHYLEDWGQVLVDSFDDDHINFQFFVINYFPVSFLLYEFPPEFGSLLHSTHEFLVVMMELLG